MKSEKIMTYEFLENFHKRVEIVAIVDFITARVSRKTKFKEYGMDASEAINLTMLVLCFIMEKSLVEEVCTKNDIAAFIRKLDIEYMKKNIPDDEYATICEHLIKDCLQNNGIPYYFSTYNFKNQKEENINIKLIDDKRVSYDNESIYSYYMTPQGYKFMFNTLEIEDAMQVSIEQFKLSLSIKKKNFSAARNNVDSLYNISKTQIQRINYFIKKVKEDIGSAGIEEYEKIYSATFTSIDEQKEGYDNLYELIKKALDSIMESRQENADRDVINNDAKASKLINKEIENISYIKNRLKFIINEQSNLLLKQQELQKVYNEAIDNILYIGFDNRMDFEEVITKKLEENPDLSYPLIKIFRPLFKPDPNRFFNIKMALKEQRIADTTTWREESNVLMSGRYFHQLESENELKIRVLNEKYLDIFEIICMYALKSMDKEILLSQLVKECGINYYKSDNYNTDNYSSNNFNSNNYSNKDYNNNEYEKLVPDLKILTNVLLQLCSIKDVDFTAIKGQKAKTVFNPSEEFDIKYCVLALLEKNQSFHACSHLKVSLSRNKKVFIPERLTEMESTDTDSFTADAVTGLNCPDILFQIEVDKIE